MQPIAQGYHRSIDGSGLQKDEEASSNSLKPISGLVADSNSRIKEVSGTEQNNTIKRLKKDLPPEQAISIDTNIDHRKLEIVRHKFSTTHLSPGTTSQQPDIEMIQFDRRIEPGNIDPAKREIFQSQANCLELQLNVSFDCFIFHTCFSPSGNHLFISGCDSSTDHRLVSWRKDADGNWWENSRSMVGSQIITLQLNQSENTLLTCDSQDGNVKVSTLNSDGRWEESLVLEHTPLVKGYEPVMASFSPLQDKIMTYDHHAGKINVLQVDGNNRWTRLNQPAEIRQSSQVALNFKATNNYLLTYNDTQATIWGCSDQSNCIKQKFDRDYGGFIEDCQLSNDERHAFILLRNNQVFFLACDDNGHWSQVGEVRHFRQTYELEVKVDEEPDRTIVDWNHIYTASFNASGQYALTSDFAKQTIISGYDDNGAWVEKLDIRDCDYAFFSHTGRKVLARLSTGSYKIWDCTSTGISLDKAQTLEHIDSKLITIGPSENLFLSYGDETNYACIWGDDGEGHLVEKARVCHQGGIFAAHTNAQEDSVLTVGHDCTVKIQGLERDGKWREQLVVQNKQNIDFAEFSPSGRLAFTVSQDSTACILGRDDNGEWVQHAVIKRSPFSIKSAKFNKLENHFLIFGNHFMNFGKDNDKPGFVQLWSIGDDGKWAKTELIKLDHPVKEADFSPDGDHLII
ncbi:WD40 repeat domain-containing protein, partial [Endozoicomonas sp. SESOKO1]|uniref:WD40 repeat domain-containing protein n=1 Tax=Endozoicomonas sp. SESOKO1 TaxID=2828742 RepID=UPI002147B748